jgi:hypothetical protein
VGAEYSPKNTPDKKNVLLSGNNQIAMELIIGIGVLLGIIFLIGLLSRKKGDNMLDTLSSGCGTVVAIVIIIAVVIFFLSQQ